MLRARFRMNLPEEIWAAEISTSFPDATLRLLTGVPKGERALELGEVQGATPEAISNAIQAHKDIFDYQPLYIDDRRVIAQYEAEEKALYEFLWTSSLPPEFPILIEDGEMEFDLTATQEHVESFGSALDNTGLQYELLMLVHTDEQEGLLTNRQREYLTRAYQRGYFDVPRACTLAELADVLDVDKSSASETIRRGAGRIIGQFLMSRN